MLSSITSRQLDQTEITAFLDPFPGFTALQASLPKTGIVVTSLQSRGPAERAGVQVGDNIVAINHRPINSVGQALAALRRTPNQTVQLHLLHNHVPNDVSLSRIEDPAHGT